MLVATELHADRHLEREYLSLDDSVMQGHRLLAIKCGEVQLQEPADACELERWAQLVLPLACHRG